MYLDSSLKAKERREVLKTIATGETDLIIGTHACIGKDVVFHDLALTIVDEEHRFGVQQRAAILKKANEGAHSITMSATPIPRSLSNCRRRYETPRSWRPSRNAAVRCKQICQDDAGKSGYI